MRATSGPSLPTSRDHAIGIFFDQPRNRMSEQQDRDADGGCEQTEPDQQIVFTRADCCAAGERNAQAKDNPARCFDDSRSASQTQCLSPSQGSTRLPRVFRTCNDCNNGNAPQRRKEVRYTRGAGVCALPALACAVCTRSVKKIADIMEFPIAALIENTRQDC